MESKIYLVEFNNDSNRYAFFEDDEISGWLYLTKPGEKKPDHDCWIYNRIPVIDPKDIINYKNGPPPASSEYAKDDSRIITPKGMNIRLLWSSDGHSIALMINDAPFGYINGYNKLGYSRNLIKPGPWGNVFDEILFNMLFQH